MSCFDSIEFVIRLGALKIGLMLCYKPNNIHRWSRFTKNPWNKYGLKYCLLR